jgi:hypothetical protein
MKVEIEDTGVGIRELHLKKLFKKFGKVKNSDGLNENGCGLGLTICKKISKKMGGGITVESVFSEGSKFTFYFKVICLLVDDDDGDLRVDDEEDDDEEEKHWNHSTHEMQNINKSVDYNVRDSLLILTCYIDCI